MTYLKNILIAAGVFLAPVAVSFLSVFIMIIIDFITALLKAWYTKTEITSKRMRESIGKTLAYFFLIVAAHLLDNWFIIPFFGTPLIYKFLIFFIGSIEFKSIVENIGIFIGAENVQKILSFLSQAKRKGDS